MMYLNGGNVGFVMKVVVSEDTVIVIADICRKDGGLTEHINIHAESDWFNPVTTKRQKRFG